MTNFKKAMVAGLCATMISPLTGCYSMTVQAADIAKPVSISRSTGTNAKAVRSFRHESVSWWVIGLVPMFTFPGVSGVNFMTPADKLTSEVLQRELQQGGNGVADLTVTTQQDVMSFLLGAVVGLIPFGGLVRPMSVVVEGKIVQ